MSRTESNMLPLGTKAPDFTLPDTVSGDSFHLDDVEINKGILIIFMCNHCPFVIHVIDTMVKLTDEYIDKGITVLAISSNDVENYPQDRPDKMKEMAHNKGFRFPYLYDETQEVAKSYDAACTPDFYLFDSEKILVYRGQLDGSRPGNGVPVTGTDLRNAMDSLLAGKTISPLQRPSVGCNIKWKHA